MQSTNVHGAHIPSHHDQVKCPGNKLQIPAITYCLFGAYKDIAGRTASVF